MGGGSWSSDDYRTAKTYRTANNIKDFGHDDDVRSGRASGIHNTVDPTVKAGASSTLAGQPVRESRDSDEHPESLPIACFFDVTGSMGRWAGVLQSKLANLMDIVIDKAGVVHPQICVGAIGDSKSDRYPFQVGQFEADNKFDEQLRAFILEGNGGGQNKESYGLAFKFAADHTATDHWDKRGKKGYLFTMGDEGYWPDILATEVNAIYGISNAETETVESLFNRASERWHIYHLFINQGGYGKGTYQHDAVWNQWSSLLGERLVMVENADFICEAIAAIIYANETSLDIDSIMTDINVDAAGVNTVHNALVAVSNTNLMVGNTTIAGGDDNETMESL